MKLIKKITTLILIMILVAMTFKITPSQAYSEQPNISGKLFYIKNAYSGRYLDVSNGLAINGTNVHQYEFNGNDSQKWLANYIGDGYYSFGSMVGATSDGGTTYLHFALDVNGAIDANYTNVQLWEYHGGIAQKFALEPAGGTKYKIVSAMNDIRVVTVADAGCSNENNVFMHEYNASYNDEWLLEPVNRTSENEWFGIDYAIANAQSRMITYPNCNTLRGDCANFVSQCMVAQGIHMENEWYVYKRNGSYFEPEDTSQLDYSWDLADPSPWISASEFEDYWTERKSTTIIKGSDIIANPTWYKDTIYGMADVIQILDDGVLGTGIGREAWHTMYISGVGYSSSGVYGLKYSAHTIDRPNVCFSDYIDPDAYYKFYAL